MHLSIFFVILCSIYGLAFSGGPPLQLQEDVKISDIFQRGLRAKPRNIEYRLPTDIVPEHYTVKLRPVLETGDPENAQWDVPGEVTIVVKCVNATKTIILHALETDIEHSSVTVKSAENGAALPKLDDGEFNSANETYTITLVNDLEVGKTYNVYIPFTSKVSAKLEGLYQSCYTTLEGTRKCIATTQFEDTDARRAFPCFDEPAMKAVFDITLGYNKTSNYHALCNMDIISNEADENLPGWFWATYRSSVKMPTYLIAIIISDFESVEAPEGSFGSKPVKTWGRKELMDRSNSGAYSARITAEVLTFFETYFDQTYDLPKMDSVAIPDFPFGAMENWGLITYREELLLYFAGETTEAARNSISSVIAHENAHQWFGNIVTMNFWNDIWLNEGFSNFAANLGQYNTDPEFDSLNTGAVGQAQSAMIFDVGINTQPVSSKECNPGAIIYDKGCSILRMMNAFLTESTMQKGLRNYIAAKKYDNAWQDDLFEIVNAAAHQDSNLPVDLTIKEIMDTWTLQSGYPLVRVSKMSSNKIILSQERFKHEILKTTIDPDEFWWVPITYATANTPQLPNFIPKLWLSKITIMKTETVNANLNNDWILVNPDFRGYYRVLYDSDLTDLIKAQLDRNPSVFTSASRGQLLDDYFTAAFNEYTSIQSALELTTYMAQENTLIAWNPVLRHLQRAFEIFSSTESDFVALKNYFLEKVNGALDLIGVEQTPEVKGLNVILRSKLLDWACGLGSETCKTYALSLYSEWMAEPTINPFPVDIRAVMSCAGSALGDVDEMVFLNQQFRAATPGSPERNQWLNAMTCSSNSGLLDTYLTLSFANETLFTKAEAPSVFQKVAANSAGRDRAFEFLHRELPSILLYLDGDTKLIVDLFKVFGKYFNTQEHVSQMNNFVTTHASLIGSVSTSLREAIATAEDNVYWMSMHGKQMVSWFRSGNTSK